QIPDLARFCEAAHFGDFQVDNVHGVVGGTAQHRAESVDDLVEHEGSRRASADAQALVVARTRLLDVNVQIRDRVYHAGGLVHQPAGVGVSHQHVAALQLAGAG